MMRTMPIKNVVDAVIRLHGLDPRGDIPSDMLDAIISHINDRVETALLAWDWQEWNRTEERAYRQTWNAATQFKRVNGDGVPDELFYIPNMTYYRVLPTAVSDPPIGTLPTNTAYFEAITLLDTYLQYDQPCKRSIGQVLGIYSSDPRTSNCCSNYRAYKYHPSEMGVDICGSRGPTIFVLYQMPTPRYSMVPYLVGKTYNRGDVVFDPITGECYQALSTTTLAPASGPWNRVPFLQKWFTFVKWGAFADSLGEMDQGSAIDPNVRVATAANAEAKAMQALQQQIDSMVMQGQKVTWSFRSRSRHWCESVSWSGGSVSTLTDQCQADAGWVYPPAPGTVFVTEIIGVISGITQLVSGQDYIDVVFGSAQPSVDWTPLETSIVNTTDPTPVNVWPGVITNQTVNGFRLQLNGTPDTPNFYLSWSIRGVFGYYLSGPSSGGKGVASSAFTVRLPDNSTLTGTVIITPNDSGAGGTFTPATVALTTAAPSATFTYTPATYGVKSILTTNDRGLVNPPQIAFTSSATAYTLTGPSSGPTAAPSTPFTVELPAGGVVPGVLTVTPSDGGDGGTFTPATVNLTTAAPSATFTYTPVSNGAKTISVANNGGLSNPAPLTYTASFLPSSLANLVLWLKADSLGLSDGAAVGTWPDSSGLGNDFTQSNASKKPIFKTAIVNGEPVVRFDGVDDGLLLSAGLIPTNTTHYTILAVYKAASISAGSHTLFATGTTATAYAVQIRRDTADWAHYHRTGSDILAGEVGGVTAGAFNQVTADWDGSNIHFWRHGTLKQTTAAATMSSAASDNAIGVYTMSGLGDGAWWDGDIAEIVIYSTELSGVNRGLVESYLISKYGL